MRILVISDIHANLTAFEAVLAAAKEVDAVWCLGDLVGYGPDPNEVIERIRWLKNLICLIGNHDSAALGQIPTDSFNTEARLSIQWLQANLTPASLEFLRRLPQKTVISRVTLVHGSPRNPVWEYILDPRIAAINFNHFDTDYCLVGHTHFPGMFQQSQDGIVSDYLPPDYREPIRLNPRLIINPGSVGQPRDRDPRAAYAIYDPGEDTWEFCRAAYDIPAVQQRILAAGLPPRHAIRLGEGW